MNKSWRLQSEMIAETAAPNSRRHSIVFLGSAHDNGGSSILASNLAEAMRARGHQVAEWYLFDSQADMPSGARVFETRKRSRSPFVLFTLFFRVVRALREEKPDVLFGLQSLSSIIVGLAGRLAGIPRRISTLHNSIERHNRFLMAIDRFIGRRGFYSHIVACGQTVGESFNANGPAYARYLHVIPNGHSRPSLIAREEARRQLGLPTSGVLLGQIGRLMYQKNQNFSLDLLQRLPDASFVMIGKGPDEALIGSRIEAEGLTQRVRVVPSIAHERIGVFYSAVDLVLFPSLFEGLSLGAIEAIHAGVPPLCADIPSFREMFADSPLLTAKLLLPVSDQSVWLACIREILGNNELRRQIVAELGRLSPAYDFATMAQQYLRLTD